MGLRSISFSYFPNSCEELEREFDKIVDFAFWVLRGLRFFDAYGPFSIRAQPFVSHRS